MRITFLLFITILANTLVQAQVTGTYVVTDKPNRVFSCQDTLISLVDIFQRTEIRDLNDPNDNISKYRILRLQGSVITQEVLTSFMYTEYETVYVEKINGTVNGHNGVVIYLGITQAPAGFFKKDTLGYTVEKGAKVNFNKDFFAQLDYWSSDFETEAFEDRLVLVDEALVEHKILKEGTYWNLGKGNYKLKMRATICGHNDYLTDSLYVLIKETPCLPIDISTLPALCRDQVIDITPFVKIDGQVASMSQLSQMTFTDRSNAFNQASGLPFDPTAMNMGVMVNAADHSPNIEVSYQPNVALGVCNNYFFRPSMKIPTKYTVTNFVFAKDNDGVIRNYQIDDDYYGFNNTFDKSTFKKLYLNHFDIFNGTSFYFYSDPQLTTQVTGANLAVGDYSILALNPTCVQDSSLFKVSIKNRDYDLTWQYASNLGKGYYIFTAPTYATAIYAWSVWGGSIVSGYNTNEITVYVSPAISTGLAVNSQITLPGARLEGASALFSATYIDVPKESVLGIHPEMADSKVLTGIYPNPGNGTFAISGAGTFDLKVYDVLGQLVLDNTAYEANTPLILTSKGIHMVHAKQAGDLWTWKVIVQ